MNRKASLVRAALLALLFAHGGCGGSVTPLILGLDDRTTQVGSLLEVIVRGTVPGEISLQKPHPATVQLIPLQAETATAMMRWIPLASEVGMTPLTFALAAGSTTATETMTVTVRPSEIGRPQFLGTPYNALLDRAEKDPETMMPPLRAVSLRLQVKDDDDTSILLQVVPGTELQNGVLDVDIDGKSATYTFTPSKAQLDERCSFGTQVVARDAAGQEARAGVFIEVRNGCGAEPGVLINEIYYAPDGDANGDGTVSAREDEFVELVNVTDHDIELGGATIRDDSMPRFVFPTPTTLSPRQAAVVFGGGTPKGFGADIKVFVVPGAFGSSGLALNDTGDLVTLRSSDGSTIDSVRFPADCAGCNSQTRVSITRGEELSRATRFIPHDQAQGAAGRRYSPGRRADGKPF